MTALAAVVAALCGGFCGALAPPASAPTPATVGGVPVAQLGGRGAPVPFTEYEAENGRTNGTLIGPDRTFGTLAAEASNRRAVRLERPGDYVEFVLARPANALTVRLSIPDSEDGAGREASLGVYVGGARIGQLAATSRYGWVYGRYPFSNRPADGGAHHGFDEARVRLGRTLPAGAVVRLMVGPQDGAPWYAVDLADFEQVAAPAPAPARALSVLAFGADPSGRREAGGAIQAALDAGRAAHRPVWLPPGTYRVSRHLHVDAVELAGAGPWWSVLRGPGVGVFGRTDGVQSRRVRLHGFAIFGEVTARDDHAPLAGVGGAMGAGSRISDLWIQHTKGGLWFDGPMDGLTVRRLRILDQAADGLNFHRGVSHALVEDSFVRNSGDDGLAAWSGAMADHDIAFRRNTVVAPILANGVAIYGGRDIEVSDNLVADVLTEGGGLHLGNRFRAVPLVGRIALSHNLVVRAGQLDPRWKTGVGAFWLYALDAPIVADIRVRDLELVDSAYEAIQVRGQRIEGLQLDNVRIRGAGTYALQAEAPGAASFRRVVATGLGRAGIYDCGADFVVRDLGGGRGWASRAPCPPAIDRRPARP